MFNDEFSSYLSNALIISILMVNSFLSFQIINNTINIARHGRRIMTYITKSVIIIAGRTIYM